MAGFLSLTGAASAADLNIGGNPAMPTDMSDEELKRRRKQLDALSQSQRGGGGSQGPGLYGAAGKSLLGF